MSLPLDHALDIAKEHVAWSRRCRHGWLYPAEVFAALNQRPPDNPTWDDAIGALAHAWLEACGSGIRGPPTARLMRRGSKKEAATVPDRRLERPSNTSHPGGMDSMHPSPQSSKLHNNFKVYAIIDGDQHLRRLGR